MGSDSLAFDDERRVGAMAFSSRELARLYWARQGYPSTAVRFAYRTTNRGRHLAAIPPAARHAVRPLRVLDAGTGTGQLTDALLNLRIPIELVALDLSADMLAEFRQQNPNVPRVLGRFDQLPFANNSFDAIALGTSLHWGDSERTPAELRRVIRPGGAVIVLNNIDRSGSGLHDILLELPHQTARRNPMVDRFVRGMGGVNLGQGFQARPVKVFNNDVLMTPERFEAYLGSISTFHTAPPALAAKVWDKAMDYATRNLIDGKVPVPTITRVQVLEVVKPRRTTKSRG